MGEDISLEEQSKIPSMVEGAPPEGVSAEVFVEEPPAFTPEEFLEEEEELEPIFDVMTGKWLYREK